MPRSGGPSAARCWSNLGRQVKTAKELLLGKAHQKLQNRIKAKDSYQAALLQDATCYEVGPGPVRRLELPGHRRSMRWLIIIS